MLYAKWQRSGRQPEALLDHPQNPPHFPYVWNWFLSLRPGLDWPELRAWSEMTGSSPTGWECELLIALDRLR